MQKGGIQCERQLGGSVEVLKAVQKDMGVIKSAKCIY